MKRGISGKILLWPIMIAIVAAIMLGFSLYFHQYIQALLCFIVLAPFALIAFLPPKEKKPPKSTLPPRDDQDKRIILK